MAISRESLITVLYGANALNAPSDLSDGEFAFSNGSKKLFIGSDGDSTPVWVGSVVEDSAYIDWYGVTGENNKIATQYAIMQLFSSGAVYELKLANNLSFSNSDGSYYTSLKGSDSAAADITYIMPSVVGSVNQVLGISSISGSDVSLSWATASGGSGSPGGSDTQVQFNDGGSFGGDSGLLYNKTTDSLTVSGDLAVNGGDITTTNSAATIFNSNATEIYFGITDAVDIRMGKSDGSGNVRIYGTINNPQGDIVTSASTSNVFNTTTTTINIGGAATLFKVGGSTGTFDINNPTVEIGNSATSSATIVAASAVTTGNIFNTVSTTLNIGGAATSLTLGAITGNSYIRNPTLHLGSTTATVVTASGSANTITFSPYGNFIISPTSNPSSGGDFITVTVTNAEDAGQFQILNGDIYLGSKNGGAEQASIIFEGVTANGFELTLTSADPTVDRTITLPDASGDVALISSPVNQQVQFYSSSSKTLVGDADLIFDGSNLQIGSQGDLRLADSDSSNYVALQAPSTVANNNVYTLPSSVGALGQVLSISSVVSNDAALSWDDSVSSVNTLTGDVTLFHYQSSPPVSGIAPGSRWMDSSTGEEYVYVNDGNSNQWIQPTLNPLFGTISGATTVVTSSSYAATDSDYYIGVNYAGAVTITLPASPQTGRMVVIKDESGEAGYVHRAITIVADDIADLIDNGTSAVLNISNGGIQFIYRSGWRII